MGNVIERIEKEILSWPYVTAEPHRFGGLEFRFNLRSISEDNASTIVKYINAMKVETNLADHYRKDCSFEWQETWTLPNWLWLKSSQSNNHWTSDRWNSE